MSETPSRPNKALALSELVAGALGKLAERRGFALAELKAAWAEIAGPRYAECTEPEKIDWPRKGAEDSGGTLRVRAEGPRAVLLQHELGQLTERVNAFLGQRAIGQIRLQQGRLTRRPNKAAAPATADEGRVAAAVADVADDALKEALARLGRGVLAPRR